MNNLNNLKNYVLRTTCWALIIFVLAGCSDEVLEPGGQQQPDGSEMKTMQLPGYLAFNFSPSDKSFTRADDSATPSLGGISFHDGVAEEYALAPGKDHHFVVFYKTSTDETPVAIFPLEFNLQDPNRTSISGVQTSQNGEDIIYDNVTCVINELLYDTEIAKDLEDPESLKNTLSGCVALVLLNFDKSIIYTSTDGPVPADYPVIKSTYSNTNLIKELKKSDFADKLQLKNYKIKVSNGGMLVVGNSTGKDYLTMTNAVYWKDAAKDLNSNIHEEHKWFYPTPAEAKTNPALDVYVERLAVKYTVDFKSVMGELLLDNNDVLTTNVNVKIFDNNQGNGVEYTEDGYIIHSQEGTATVKILGVGVGGVEKHSMAYKDIANGNYFNGWNDYGSYGNNHRCYWSLDPNYTLRASTQSAKSPSGYPHQFRQALETDSILSVHNGTGYRNFTTTYSEVSNIGVEVTNVGTIDTDKAYWNDEVVLSYTKFEDIKGNLNSKPFYSLENTYYDPGMTGGTWAWPWEKAPYSAATHLIVAAQILNLNNPNLGTNQVSDLYNGQNNIFYTSKESLLKSKLEIFNQILLSGGNSGIRVLHALFDLHKPYTDANFPGESENVANDEAFQNLYKLAWNNDSKLWFAQMTENGENPDEYGNRWNLWEAREDNLDLIQAEISGGDGQMLIAPSVNYTGPTFKYFLAPRLRNADGSYYVKEDGTYRIDWANKVEINYHHLVALFHKIIGPIDVFTQGYMYYAIPIPHKVLTVGEDSWKRLGDISVVRNNWYNITVNSISDIGTPVQDVTQPIVPVMDVKRSYINIGVKLLKWHEVNHENVPMQ